MIRQLRPNGWHRLAACDVTQTASEKQRKSVEFAGSALFHCTDDELNRLARKCFLNQKRMLVSVGHVVPKERDSAACDWMALSITPYSMTIFRVGSSLTFALKTAPARSARTPEYRLALIRLADLSRRRCPTAFAQVGFLR
jgi:hypothetical protein